MSVNEVMTVLQCPPNKDAISHCGRALREIAPRLATPLR